MNRLFSFSFLFFSFVLLVLSACNKSPVPNQGGASSGVDGQQGVAVGEGNAPASGAAVATPIAPSALEMPYYKRMEGLVEGEGLVWHITGSNNVLQGSYVQTNSKHFGELMSSTSETVGQFALLEYDYTLKDYPVQTASIKGRFGDAATFTAIRMPKEGATVALSLQEKYPAGTTALRLVERKRNADKAAAEKARLSINLLYPQIRAGLAPAAAQAIDQAIERRMSGFLLPTNRSGATVPGIEEAMEMLQKSYDKDGKPYQMTWFYEVSSSVFANENHVLNLLLSAQTYSGGARPEQTVASLAFDLKTGKPLYLADFFQTGFEHRLRKVIEQILRKKNGLSDEEAITQVGFVKNEVPLPQHFTLNKHSLTVWYNPYELRAGSTPTSIIIPIADIADIIAKEAFWAAGAGTN